MIGKTKTTFVVVENELKVSEGVFFVVKLYIRQIDIGCKMENGKKSVNNSGLKRVLILYINLLFYTRHFNYLINL